MMASMRKLSLLLVLAQHHAFVTDHDLQTCSSESCANKDATDAAVSLMQTNIQISPERIAKKQMEEAANSRGDKPGVAPSALATRSEAGSKLRTWRDALKEDPDLFTGCKKIFLDVGSNQGTHIRKLFEAKKYPNCPYHAVFEEGFGDSETRAKPFKESGICAFGFEANPRWTQVLGKVEKAYAAQGWKAKWFVPQAVSNATGTLTFYKNDEVGNLNYKGLTSDWQFSMEKLSPGAEEVPVPTIDFSAFIEEMHKAAPAGYRLMKMDIESAEYTVLPPFLTKNLLCKNVLDTITIEWHAEPKFLKTEAERMNAADIALKVHSPENCDSGISTRVVPLDDESYLNDGKPLP